MTRKELVQQIFSKRSYLCIGLDTDIEKIPRHLLSSPDPVFEFNKQVIDATKDLCVSYKINTAFYEARGIKGWESLEKTVNYIPNELFKIADAKRGDIGNTSSQYAKAFFETLNFDAITVAPYMGEDSINYGFGRTMCRTNYDSNFKREQASQPRHLIRRWKFLQQLQLHHGHNIRNDRK